MTGSGIIAANFRRLDKGTLLGSCDLTVLAWRITFCGCLWFRQNGKEWVNFPGREWLDRAGLKQFAILVKFTDDTVKDRFQRAALAAVHAIATQQPGGVRAPASEGAQP